MDRGKQKRQQGSPVGKCGERDTAQLGRTVGREKKVQTLLQEYLSSSIPSQILVTRGSRRAPSRISKIRPGGVDLFTGRWGRPHGRGPGPRRVSYSISWLSGGGLGMPTDELLSTPLLILKRPRRNKPQSQNISSKVRSGISTILQPDPFLNAMMGPIQQCDVPYE